MQAMVTVIITTVLQMQSGLRASLSARSVTGPAFLQEIHSNITMQSHRVLCRAHIPLLRSASQVGGRWLLRTAEGSRDIKNTSPRWACLGDTNQLKSQSSCFPLTVWIATSTSNLLSCVIPVFLLELNPSSAHQLHPLSKLHPCSPPTSCKATEGRCHQQPATSKKLTMQQPSVVAISICVRYNRRPAGFG